MDIQDEQDIKVFFLILYILSIHVNNKYPDMGVSTANGHNLQFPYAPSPRGGGLGWGLKSQDYDRWQYISCELP